MGAANDVFYAFRISMVESFIVYWEPDHIILCPNGHMADVATDLVKREGIT